MSYGYRYINRQYQFKEVSYTLVLEDSVGGPLPTIRIDKTFKTCPSLIDDTFLYNEARIEILRVLSEPQPETILATTEGKDG